MTPYIQFTQTDGSTFLVETDEIDEVSHGPLVKASANEFVGKAIVGAQTLFEQAVDEIIQRNAKAFLQAIRNLSDHDRPESMEVTFAIKATLEVGNVAIAKGSSEANYTVKITWKR